MLRLSVPAVALAAGALLFSMSAAADHDRHGSWKSDRHGYSYHDRDYRRGYHRGYERGYRYRDHRYSHDDYLRWRGRHKYRDYPSWRRGYRYDYSSRPYYWRDGHHWRYSHVPSWHSGGYYLHPPGGIYGRLIISVPLW